MLDFGFSEILLTSAIALVVLGPERLPKVARQVGNWMGRARAMARQLSEQLEREVSADELLKAQTKKLEAPLPNRIAPLPVEPSPSLPSPNVGHSPEPDPVPAVRSGHAEYDPPVAADTHSDPRLPPNE
jgi:sec-independent protein translocase protein TatB